MKNFTLVEVLATIGIIAILAGIFVPAVMRMKEAGRNTVCVNNQKQLFLCEQMYHTANSNYILPANNWEYIVEDKEMPKGIVLCPNGGQYTRNSSMGGTWGVDYWDRQSRLLDWHEPERSIILFDGNAEQAFWKEVKDRAVYRHVKKLNILFLDGNVKAWNADNLSGWHKINGKDTEVPGDPNEWRDVPGKVYVFAKDYQVP